MHRYVIDKYITANYFFKCPLSSFVPFSSFDFDPFSFFSHAKFRAPRYLLFSFLAVLVLVDSLFAPPPF